MNELPEFIQVLVNLKLDNKIKSLSYSFNPDGSCEIFVEQNTFDSHVWDWKLYKHMSKYSSTLNYLKEHCND